MAKNELKGIAIDNIKEHFEQFPTSKAEINQTEQLVLRIQLLEIRLTHMEAYIKSVFDGHVLINGQFRKITP